MHFINKGDMWPRPSNKPNDPFALKNYGRTGQTLKSFLASPTNCLAENEPLPLPPSDDLGILAQEFSDFFQDRIDNIMSQFQPTPDCPTDSRCIEDRFLT